MAKLIRHRRDENRSDDVIVCKVCLTCYDDGPHLPLLLHCRHTFCGLCIADCLTRPDDRSVVVCPLCKARTGLTRKGLAGLGVNQASVEAVGRLAKENHSQPTGRDDDAATHGTTALPPLSSSSSAPQLKGILKTRPKQVFGLSRHDPRLSPDRSDKENGDGKISEAHRVIVKSVDHLHPPPHHSNFESVQSAAAAAAADAGDADNSTNGFDISKVEFRVPEEEEKLASNPSAILNSLSRDVIEPRSAESIDQLGPQPMDAESGEDPGRGRLYPLTALLSMASSVPRDQLTMGSELSSLTEAQRRLPSNAKYVGRFGNYSAIRQPGSMQRPQKMAVSADGTRLAIVDPHSQGVHVFSARGEFVHFFLVPNVSGGVAFLAEDHLAVTTAAAVQVYLTNGLHRKTIPVAAAAASGPSGPLGASAGVLAVAPLKQGFVAASRNRISVCRSLVSPVVHSINGKRNAQLPSKLIPFEEIVDVAVSARGELCILESKAVFVTDEDGLIVTSIRPTEDSPCGPIGRGHALASCPDDGSIVVVDVGLRRVLLFGTEGHFLSCLLNFHDAISSDANVNGVFVTKSKKLFLLLTGHKMAEVRAYAF